MNIENRLATWIENESRFKKKYTLVNENADKRRRGRWINDNNMKYKRKTELLQATREEDWIIKMLYDAWL